MSNFRQKASLVALGLILSLVSMTAYSAESSVCAVKPSKIARENARQRGIEVNRDKGYGVEEIRDGVYWATDGNFTMAVVTTGEGAVLIDTPPSMGAKLTEIAAAVTDEPITHVIYTHAHADHIGGASKLPEDITYVASAGTAEELARINRPREYPFGVFVDGGSTVPSPTLIVEDTHTLEVGNKTIELKNQQDSHSHGDMTAYLPDQKVLVATDFTWPASVPWVRLGDAVNVPGLIAVNKQLLDYDFDALVAGHFNILGTREDVEQNIAYLEDLRQASVKALQEVSVGQVVQETGDTNPYTLMDKYFQRVVDRAAEPVIAKWRDKLQGAGVWTCQHAQKMVSSLRFDEAAE